MAEYRPVVGVTGYRVGDDGSVWTCLRKVGLGNGGGVKYVSGDRWVQMQPTATRNGHLYVTIRGARRYVHHLVLEAFVGPRPEGLEACHFPDRNPANNCRNNLRWASHKDNETDKVAHGTHNRGSRNGQAKLTEIMVQWIRADAEQGLTPTQISRKHNISRSQARRIVTGQRWAHLPWRLLGPGHTTWKTVNSSK